MPLNEFKENVSAILRGEVRSLREMLDSNDQIADCIEIMPAGVRDLKATDLFSPEVHIQTRLGHVSVNPNDSGNTAVLKDAYVYSQIAIPLEQDTGAVNYSEDRANDFVTLLKTKAHQFRTLSITTKETDTTGKTFSASRNLLLVGDKGSGKTFFINHLFSRFHGQLNDEKIVWVRINLVPDRNLDGDVHHWILAQIAKILFRYYDTDSQRNQRMPTIVKLDFYQRMKRWLAEKYTDSQLGRYQDALEDMWQAFSVQGNDEEIGPNLCQKSLCRELFRIARLEGYSFIVVLDGLDRLEADSYYKKRFDTISAEVRQIWSSYEMLGAVFLYVTRGETFDAHRNVAPYNKFGDDARFHIDSISVTQILARRVEAIAKEIPKLQQDDSARWGQRDWTTLIRSFETHFKTAEPEEQLAALDRTFDKNNRAKVQIIQTKFQEFLQAKTHKGYKLLEHMMLAGKKYPPLFYKYHLVGDKLEIEIPDQTHIDNRYIPIITRPPLLSLPQARRQQAGWFNAGALLLGVRIIQLCLYFDEWLQGSADREEPIVVHEIADILETAFGYDRKQAIAAIWEFESFEILRPIYNGNGNDRSENTYISTYPNASFILRSCLQDVAFLNLCGMRTPITKREHKHPALLREAALESGKEGAIDRWILGKVINSLTMVHLLRGSNEDQRNSFERRIKSARLSNDMRRFMSSIPHRKLFGVIDDIVPEVEKEIWRIYKIVEEGRDGVTLAPERLRNQVKAVAERLKVI